MSNAVEAGDGANLGTKTCDRLDDNDGKTANYDCSLVRSKDTQHPTAIVTATGNVLHCGYKSTYTDAILG